MTDPRAKTLYEVVVPEEERAIHCDIPEAFRVVENPWSYPACIVEGRYYGVWLPNPPCRWLVWHLLKEKQ